MTRQRKETREEAQARATAADHEAFKYRLALRLAMRPEHERGQIFGNDFWRFIVGPERASGDRVVVVFDREAGRVLPSGDSEGEWTAAWWSDLQKQRKIMGTYFSSDNESACRYCDLMDETYQALWLQEREARAASNV